MDCGWSAFNWEWNWDVILSKGCWGLSIRLPLLSLEIHSSALNGRKGSKTFIRDFGITLDETLSEPPLGNFQYQSLYGALTHIVQHFPANYSKKR